MREDTTLRCGKFPGAQKRWGREDPDKEIEMTPLLRDDRFAAMLPDKTKADISNLLLHC